MFFFLPIGYGGGGILGFIIIYLIIRGIARLLFRSKGGQQQWQWQQGQQQQRTYSQTQTRDPYTVLGVTREASDDDIKKAYRKLIRENHPDMVMDKSDAEKKQAEKRFREVQEAYENICKMRGIN